MMQKGSKYSLMDIMRNTYDGVYGSKNNPTVMWPQLPSCVNKIIISMVVPQMPYVAETDGKWEGWNVEENIWFEVEKCPIRIAVI